MAKKVRFTITAQGQESELLAIRETSASDLVVMIKRSEQLGSGRRDEYSNTLDHRISVHVTPEQEWNTIKSHARLEGGIYQKTYAKVLPNNGRIIWLCCGMSTPDLSSPHYALRSKANDKIINIGSYSPKSSVLVYFLVVTTSSFTIRPPINLNSEVAKFAKFNAHVFWAFMASPSFHQGECMMGAGFGETEVNGNLAISIKVFDNSRSLTRKDLIKLTKDMLGKFSQTHVYKFHRAFGEKARQLEPDLTNFARQYHKDPIA